MCIFDNPEQHAANPPETWEVVRVTDRHWDLRPRGAEDASLATYPTKRQALLARTEGTWFDLYHREGRWYAGEDIPNWKPYAEVLAERNRHIEWLERKARERAERQRSA